MQDADASFFGVGKIYGEKKEAINLSNFDLVERNSNIVDIFVELLSSLSDENKIALISERDDWRVVSNNILNRLDYKLEN